MTLREWEKENKTYCIRSIRSSSEKKRWKTFLEYLESLSDSTELLMAAENCLIYLDIFEQEKLEIQRNLYYFILKAHVDLGNFEKVIEYKDRMINIAKEEYDYEDLDARASYQEGRALALSGKFEDAVSIWMKLVKKTQNLDRLAQLYHEIGRCYFKMEQLKAARYYGLISLESGRETNNYIWIRNAALLVAQIEVARNYNSNAIEFYEVAEAAARKLKDNRLVFSIITEKFKLGKQIRRPKIESYECDRKIKMYGNNKALRRPKLRFDDL